MRCAEIMKTSVVYVTEDESAQAASQLMREANVGFLPVCDDKRCIGTMTDRDLTVRVLAAGKAGDTLIGDVMTHDVISCLPDDDIERAAELMSENLVSRVLVCDSNGELKGVISLSDLPRAKPHTAVERASSATTRSGGAETTDHRPR